MQPEIPQGEQRSKKENFISRIRNVLGTLRGKRNGTPGNDLVVSQAVPFSTEVHAPCVDRDPLTEQQKLEGQVWEVLQESRNVPVFELTDDRIKVITDYLSYLLEEASIGKADGSASVRIELQRIFSFYRGNIDWKERGYDARPTVTKVELLEFDNKEKEQKELAFRVTLKFTSDPDSDKNPETFTDRVYMFEANEPYPPHVATGFVDAYQGRDTNWLKYEPSASRQLNIQIGQKKPMTITYARQIPVLNSGSK